MSLEQKFATIIYAIKYFIELNICEMKRPCTWIRMDYREVSKAEILPEIPQSIPAWITVDRMKYKVGWNHDNIVP